MLARDERLVVRMAKTKDTDSELRAETAAQIAAQIAAMNGAA
jgi:hypothetical protein